MIWLGITITVRERERERELPRRHKIDSQRQNFSLTLAISSRMIDRIFSGAVTKGGPPKNGKMNYSDFVWFLLSEEDKRNPTRFA